MRRKSIETVLREAEVEADIPAIDVTPLAKRLKEHRQRVSGGGIGRGWRVRRQDCDPRQIGGTPRAGLRTNGGEAKPTDEEGPAPHSMTSSARASSKGGTSSPSALAVFRLITNSNLVGCSTGSSAGLAPLSTFPA